MSAQTQELNLNSLEERHKSHVHPGRGGTGSVCKGPEAGMLLVQKPRSLKGLDHNVSGKRRMGFGFDFPQYGEPMEVCVLF